MNSISDAVTESPCCDCCKKGKCSEKDFLRQDFRKMLHLSVPVFLEILLRTLLGNIDQLMLSSYSSNAVASVSNANQIINILTLVLQVACIAATIIIVQHIGAKEEQKLPQVYSVAVAVNVVFSMLLSMTIFSQNGIFSSMRLAPELVPDAKVYFTIVAAGFFVQGLTMSFSAILRGNARVKEIMLVSVMANIINVFGNALLIHGFGPVPALGAAGTAISTVASQSFSLCLTIFVYRTKIAVPLKWSFTKANFKMAFDLLRLGIPAAGDSFSYNAMILVAVSFINSYGTASTTARAYVNMVSAFIYMSSLAIGQATQITAGNLIGAKKISRTKRLVSKSIRISVIIASVVALVIHIFSNQIFSLFTTDSEILSLIKTVTLIDILLESGRAINMVVIDSLLAAGDVLVTVICGISSVWLVSVPVGYFAGTCLELGILGVWIGMALDECIRGGVLYLRWRSNKWQGKKIITSD